MFPLCVLFILLCDQLCRCVLKKVAQVTPHFKVCNMKSKTYTNYHNFLFFRIQYGPQLSEASWCFRDYSEGLLEKAVEVVKKGLSHRKAAIEFGIARATLNRAVSGPINKPGRPYVIPVEDQQKLAECTYNHGW